MKFRIFATVAVWALAINLAVSGQTTAPIAAVLAIVASAGLCSVQRNGCYTSVCPTPFDALRIATENLPDTIHRKASWRSPLLAMVERGVFPKNAGVNQTTFVIGNSEPTSNSEGWTDLALASNVITTMCSTNYTDTDVGFNEYTYVPRRFGLKSPVICRETLAFAHQPAKFLAQYQRELVKRAKRTWELEFRNTYMALASKMIARPGLTVVNNTTTFPQVAATSQLTQDILDAASLTLMEAGATDVDEDTIEWGPDGPLFTTLIGIDALQKLTTNVSTRRDDLRYADMGKGPNAELMKRLGASRTLRNNRLVPELLPPRFSFVNGVGYTQVDTWEMVASSEGTVAQITAAYQNALYEAVIIFHPKVFTAEMVAPDGAGLNWSPANYMGEWVWRTTMDANISDTYCMDPIGKFGRHFAEFMYAPNAIFRDAGMTIIFKRCPGDQNFAACVS